MRSTSRRSRRTSSDMSSGRSGTQLGFADHAFPDRVGWREITLITRDGARVSSTTVPARSESDELHAYPKNLLRSPLDVTTASAAVTPGTRPGAPPLLSSRTAPEHQSSRFEGLINQ